MGASASWNPKGLSRLVMGELYLFTYVWRLLHLTLPPPSILRLPLDTPEICARYAVLTAVRFRVMFAWDMVLCGVVGTDVSERPSVSIIRVEQQDERGRWYMIEDGQQDSSKLDCVPTRAASHPGRPHSYSLL
jgi:hypothetical protein